MTFGVKRLLRETAVVPSPLLYVQTNTREYALFLPCSKNYPVPHLFFSGNTFQASIINGTSSRVLERPYDPNCLTIVVMFQLPPRVRPIPFYSPRSHIFSRLMNFFSQDTLHEKSSVQSNWLPAPYDWLTLIARKPLHTGLVVTLSTPFKSFVRFIQKLSN